MTDSKVKEDVPNSPDVHFEPVIQLAEVDVKTLEEEEDELLKLRAKLYRFASSPTEWKERGTGFVKLLKHKQKGTVRLLMRRDKTLKICANHYITPWMELQPKSGNDKAWIWSVAADFADEVPTEELLAIRFGSIENAKLFKSVFDECKLLSTENEKSECDSEEISKNIEKLALSSGETSFAEPDSAESNVVPEEEKSVEVKSTAVN